MAGPLFFDGKPDGHPDPGKDNVLRLIRELGDQGLNFIDTAEQYGGGESERRVGEAILGHRDEWILSSKFGYRVGEQGQRVDDSSPPTIMSSLEGSLGRLKTDVIDVYLYHCAPDRAGLDEARLVLEQARKKGKIRYYGISTSDVDLVRDMAAKDMVDVVQYPTSLLNESAAMSDLAGECDMGTQLRGVMAQGRLSGKYLSAAPELADDDIRKNWMSAEDYTGFETLQALIPSEYSLAQLAIRWMLDDPRHHSICLGAKNQPDYQSAIQALDLPTLAADTRQAVVSWVQRQQA